MDVHFAERRRGWEANRRATAASKVGWALKHRGDLDQALAELDLAQSLLGKGSPSFYYAHALDDIGHVHFQLESYEEAIRWFTEAKAAYEACGLANGIGCDIQIEEATKRLNLAPNSR